MELSMDDEQVVDLKEVFNSYEKGGVMDIKDIGSALRALGVCPTEAELKIIMDTSEADDQGGLDFEKFVILARSKLKGSDQEDEIRKAFRFFDKEGHGTIKVSELHQIMTSIGETLSEEEVKEMIADADGEGSGTVNYEEFVTIMLSI